MSVCLSDTFASITSIAPKSSEAQQSESVSIWMFRGKAHLAQFILDVCKGGLKPHGSLKKFKNKSFQLFLSMNRLC